MDETEKINYYNLKIFSDEDLDLDEYLNNFKI